MRIRCDSECERVLRNEQLALALGLAEATEGENRDVDATVVESTPKDSTFAREETTAPTVSKGIPEFGKMTVLQSLTARPRQTVMPVQRPKPHRVYYSDYLLDFAVKEMDTVKAFVLLQSKSFSSLLPHAHNVVHPRMRIFDFHRL